MSFYVKFERIYNVYAEIDSIWPFVWCFIELANEKPYISGRVAFVLFYFILLRLGSGIVKIYRAISPWERNDTSKCDL